MSHTGKAIAVGIVYAIIFVALPIAFISTISSILIQNGLDPAEYFHGTQTYVLIFGLTLTVFASLTAYFEKGSRERLGVGMIGALFLVLWGYFFIKSMSIFYAGDTYSYEVLVPGIALILAISLSIRLLYRAVEFAVYRDEFAYSSSPPIQQNPPQYSYQAYPPTQTQAPAGEEPEFTQENDEEVYLINIPRSLLRLGHEVHTQITHIL